jgi:hypothetical protein
MRERRRRSARASDTTRGPASRHGPLPAHCRSASAPQRANRRGAEWDEARPSGLFSIRFVSGQTKAELSRPRQVRGATQRACFTTTPRPPATRHHRLSAPCCVSCPFLDPKALPCCTASRPASQTARTHASPHARPHTHLPAARVRARVACPADDRLEELHHAHHARNALNKTSSRKKRRTRRQVSTPIAQFRPAEWDEVA